MTPLKPYVSAYVGRGYCRTTRIGLLILLFFFFFQAEDGIRDHCVTGVQTCALPILRHIGRRTPPPRSRFAMCVCMAFWRTAILAVVFVAQYGANAARVAFSSHV